MSSRFGGTQHRFCMKKRSGTSDRVTRAQKISVSVVIVQFNNPHLTEQCLRSLSRLKGIPLEIIVVDNNSTDPNARTLGRKFGTIRFIQNDHNDGFGAANNKGASFARGDFLLFLNNDTLAHGNFVSPVVELFEGHPEIGIIGPKLTNSDHTLQLSCGDLPSIFNEMLDRRYYRKYESRSPHTVRHAEGLYSEIREVEWVTGAALFIRRELFEQLRGFDEEFFMFFEDKDLCLRARLLGAQVMYTPAASVVHVRGASANSSTKRYYRSSQIRYYEKHRNLIEQILLKSYLIIGRRLSDG